MKAKYNAQQRAGSTPSRRSVLGGSASLAAASLLSGQASASTRRSSPRPVIVQVFLRQAMDGLTTVVPYADGDLYFFRPTLAVPPPGATDGALDLDGFFGFAPAAAPLLTPFNDGRLLVVHACGSPDPTRSHFEAFARMEIADPSLPLGVLTTGWLTRYLQQTSASATGALRGLAAGSFLPYSLRGATKTLPVPDFQDFQFPGRAVSAGERQLAIFDAYSRRLPPLGTTALDTIASFGLGGIDFAAYVPENGAQYPLTPFGARLRSVAAMIKGDIGLEVVNIDVEGWDLHANLGPLHGPMSRLLDELTRSLEAFYLDLLGHVDDYVLVCLSEFGRHVPENASAGLDHGHGNAMFVMGGHVNGGQVLADWPGLSRPVQDNGDLAITTDYRDILGEVLIERCGITDLAPIFPQHTYTSHGVIS